MKQPLLLLLALSTVSLPAIGQSANETKLEFEHRVDAPADALYQLMTSLEGVISWWQQANQLMGEQFEVRHLGGPTAGVGMQVGFASPEGDVFEHWTVTAVEPSSTIRMDVDFQIGTVFDRILRLSEQEGSTVVLWTETGQVESAELREMLSEMSSSAIENRKLVLDSAALAATGER